MSLLTVDRVERICEALRSGGSKRAAAASAGIDPYTLYDWLRKGRRDVAFGRYGSEYVELLRAVEKAESDAELVAVGTIGAVGRGGLVRVPVLDELRRPVRDEQGELIYEVVYEKPRWEALAWLLERRFPEEWAKRSEVTVNRGSSATQVEVVDEDVVTLFESASKLLGEAVRRGAERALEHRTPLEQVVEYHSERVSLNSRESES